MKIMIDEVWTKAFYTFNYLCVAINYVRISYQWVYYMAYTHIQSAKTIYFSHLLGTFYHICIYVWFLMCNHCVVGKFTIGFYGFIFFIHIAINFENGFKSFFSSSSTNLLFRFLFYYYSFCSFHIFYFFFFASFVFFS